MSSRSYPQDSRKLFASIGRSNIFTDTLWTFSTLLIAYIRRGFLVNRNWVSCMCHKCDIYCFIIDIYCDRYFTSLLMPDTCSEIVYAVRVCALALVQSFFLDSFSSLFLAFWDLCICLPVYWCVTCMYLHICTGSCTECECVRVLRVKTVPVAAA